MGLDAAQIWAIQISKDGFNFSFLKLCDRLQLLCIQWWGRETGQFPEVIHPIPAV